MAKASSNVCTPAFIERLGRAPLAATRLRVSRLRGIDGGQLEVDALPIVEVVSPQLMDALRELLPDNNHVQTLLSQSWVADWHG